MELDGRLYKRGRVVEDKGVFHFEVTADHCFSIMIQVFFQHASLLFNFLFKMYCT